MILFLIAKLSLASNIYTVLEVVTGTCHHQEVFTITIPPSFQQQRGQFDFSLDLDAQNPLQILLDFEDVQDPQDYRFYASILSSKQSVSISRTFLLESNVTTFYLRLLCKEQSDYKFQSYFSSPDDRLLALDRSEVVHLARGDVFSLPIRFELAGNYSLSRTIESGLVTAKLCNEDSSLFSTDQTLTDDPILIPYSKTQCVLSSNCGYLLTIEAQTPATLHLELSLRNKTYDQFKVDLNMSQLWNVSPQISEIDINLEQTQFEDMFLYSSVNVTLMILERQVLKVKKTLVGKIFILSSQEASPLNYSLLLSHESKKPFTIQITGSKQLVPFDKALRVSQKQGTYQFFKIVSNRPKVKFEIMPVDQEPQICFYFSYNSSFPNQMQHSQEVIESNLQVIHMLKPIVYVGIKTKESSLEYLIIASEAVDSLRPGQKIVEQICKLCRKEYYFTPSQDQTIYLTLNQSSQCAKIQLFENGRYKSMDPEQPYSLFQLSSQFKAKANSTYSIVLNTYSYGFMSLWITTRKLAILLPESSFHPSQTIVYLVTPKTDKAQYLYLNDSYTENLLVSNLSSTVKLVSANILKLVPENSNGSEVSLNFTILSSNKLQLKLVEFDKDDPLQFLHEQFYKDDVKVKKIDQNGLYLIETEIIPPINAEIQGFRNLKVTIFLYDGENATTIISQSFNKQTDLKLIKTIQLLKKPVFYQFLSEIMCDQRQLWFASKRLKVSLRVADKLPEKLSGCSFGMYMLQAATVALFFLCFLLRRQWVKKTQASQNHSKVQFVPSDEEQSFKLNI